MSKADQGQIDAAHEWTAEHYPDLDGTAFDAKFAEALADIVAIDAAQDAADAKLMAPLCAL